MTKYYNNTSTNVSRKVKKNEEKQLQKRSDEDSLKGRKGPKGRGNFVTLFSKTTINYVVEAIGYKIKNIITKEAKESGMYSIQIDTTQDVSCHDQCSIVIRYVLNDTINERLLAVVRSYSGTGESLKDLLKKALLDVDLDVQISIGSSTDGAANMQGQYNGFAAWLSAESPTLVHVWCYAHVLNLVLSDTTGSVIQSASLFGLLNEIAVFLRSSHLRMDKWETTVNDPHRKRLNLIGETRWWAKASALSKVFGSLEKKRIFVIC